MTSPRPSPGPEEAQDGKVAGASHRPPSTDGAETFALKAEDILSLDDLDPALNMKMHLVNNAIDQIGWTPYHMKLFVLNGFGYGVDSLILLLQSIVAAQAFKELGGPGQYDKGLNVAAYCGMLAGALFWGLGADMIGRRWAFNCSLFVCSSSALIAGAMPSWAGLGVFVALVGFGAGGNLVLDTTVFLEYLPSNKQWVLTLMACWWGVGQFVAGALGWAFLPPPEWNCATASPCARENNMGWRYVFFSGGALVFVMSVLRVTVVRLRETPKYLLGIGDDAGVVETLQTIAAKYSRPCSLTVEQLAACGHVHSAHSKSRLSVGETMVHLRGLFATPTIARSTLMVWLSWTLIGLAYPLFYVFLPEYLAARGAALDVSTHDRWRNYMLVNVSGIFGPVLAGFMCDCRVLGRRYTMAVGALATMAFLFAYTGVRTASQDLGFSCTVGFLLNIYYGTLYAYTPEVLPTAHRATGNGVAVACNRVMGILSNVVATFGDTSTSAPIYVCAALFVCMAFVSALFPFEPYGRRSS